MDEQDLLGPAMKKVLVDMRQRKPHYYVVFKKFYDDLLANQKGNFRIEGKKVHLETSWGFYTSLSDKLGITPPAVRERLQRALIWALQRLKWHLDQGDRR